MRTGIRWLASLAGGIVLAVFAAGASQAAIQNIINVDDYANFSAGYDPAPSDCGTNCFDQTYLIANVSGLHLGSDFDLNIFFTDISDTICGVGCSILDLTVTIGGSTVLSFPPDTEVLSYFLAAGDYDVQVSGHTTTDSGGGFHVAITPVGHMPIPAAALLFGSGLAVLGFAGRKKKASQA